MPKLKRATIRRSFHRVCLLERIQASLSREPSSLRAHTRRNRDKSRTRRTHKEEVHLRDKKARAIVLVSFSLLSLIPTSSIGSLYASSSLSLIFSTYVRNACSPQLLSRTRSRSRRALLNIHPCAEHKIHRRGAPRSNRDDARITRFRIARSELRFFQVSFVSRRETHCSPVDREKTTPACSC